MDDETHTPSGIREDKLARAEARRLSRQKDHARRRHQGAKRQEVAGGMTLREFEKRFPGLPHSAFYARKGYLVGGDDPWDLLWSEPEDTEEPENDSNIVRFWRPREISGIEFAPTPPEKILHRPSRVIFPPIPEKSEIVPFKPAQP